MFHSGAHMKIISGTAHRALAERIASCLGTKLADVHVTAFPDGETFVKMGYDFTKIYAVPSSVLFSIPEGEPYNSTARPKKKKRQAEIQVPVPITVLEEDHPQLDFKNRS